DLPGEVRPALGDAEVGVEPAAQAAGRRGGGGGLWCCVHSADPDMCELRDGTRLVAYSHKPGRFSCLVVRGSHTRRACRRPLCRTPPPAAPRPAEVAWRRAHTPTPRPRGPGVRLPRTHRPGH